MATNILSKPSLAPQTERITQHQLARFVRLENQIERLTEKHKELTEELMDLLFAGVQIEPGTHWARLKTYERRSVKWKDIVIRHMGEKFADSILAITEPTQYTKLVVR